MKRRIVLRLMGEEVLDLTIDEDDYDESSDETETGALNASIDTGGQSRAVGFGAPWSVEYWDDED
jgi:hypothetical protein